MSSNSDNATALAENKVLILYILNLIDNDIRQDDLFKIITSINNINYFYFNRFNWFKVSRYTHKRRRTIYKNYFWRKNCIYSYKRCITRNNEIKGR